MENINWLEVGAFFIPVLGLGLAGLAYLTRQFNRVNDRIIHVEERLSDRITDVEERLGNRIISVEENLGNRITHVEEQLGNRVGSLEQRQARLEGRMNERFDRIDERFDRVEESASQMQIEMKSLGEGLQNVEKEQARMLGFLEGRGVMGKAPAAETVS